VNCWDRGRPARNEREARKWIRSTAKKLRACGALRAGRPRSQKITRVLSYSLVGNFPGEPSCTTNPQPEQTAVARAAWYTFALF